MTQSKQYWYASLVVGFLLLSYRLSVLALTEPGFFFDEPYYYGWSLTPDWGYYSKPPMVAWLISLSTALFGTSELIVKLPAPVLYFLTALILQKTTNEASGNAKAGFWAFLIFMLMPFVSLNSWFITTDAPLLFFWSLTTYFYLKAERTDKVAYWLLAGIFGGLGLLSKYTMILLPASLFLMYCRSGQLKKLSWKFWLTNFTALAVFSPNIFWQFNHGFPSFTHTVELANKPGWDGNPLEFIFAQFIVFGPVALAVFLFSWKKEFRQRYIELWHLSWIPLIIFSLKSVQGEAFINWAAFAYAPASVLTGILIADKSSAYKWGHIIISAVLAVGLYHYPSFQSILGIEKTKKNTPYARVEGWRELSLQVKAISDQYPDYFVGSDNRQLNAYLNYYLSDPISKLRTINLDAHISNHYELFYLLQSDERPVIWLSRVPLKTIPFNSQPAPPLLLTKLSQQVYPSYQLNLWVYLVK